MTIFSRRGLIGVGAGGLLVSGCDRLSGSMGANAFVAKAESATYGWQRLIGGQTLAQGVFGLPAPLAPPAAALLPRPMPSPYRGATISPAEVGKMKATNARQSNRALPSGAGKEE